MLFDVDPQTIERNRNNWRVYNSLGPGDPADESIILNDNGTISAPQAKALADLLVSKGTITAGERDAIFP